MGMTGKIGPGRRDFTHFRLKGISRKAAKKAQSRKRIMYFLRLRVSRRLLGAFA